MLSGWAVLQHRAHASRRRIDPLASIGHIQSQPFQIGECVRIAKHFPQLRQEGLNFTEHENEFTVGVIEHLLVDRTVPHEGTSHIPIGRDHADKPTLGAHHATDEFLKGWRIEGKEKVARLAHCFFAALIVQSQDELSALKRCRHPPFDASQTHKIRPAIKLCLVSPATGILDRIVSRKREELRDALVPAAALRRIAEEKASARRDFAAALRASRPAVISEIKKASPSKGVLVEDFNPVTLARQYEAGGAAAISVLTDRDFFQGSLADLEAARGSCSVPVIRKDFTIAEYHVLEAAASGADAILLIAAILDVPEMRAFRQMAAGFGMASLVEAHNASELDAALASGAEIIGINNRDLNTFQVSLETSIALAPRIPSTVIKVSESGIFTAADVRLLMDAGYHAFLVGEHLVKSGDPTRALQELVA